MNEDQNIAGNGVPEANKDMNNGDETQPDARTVINIEKAIIDSVNAQERSSEKKRDGYDLANLIILSLTFVAAIGAAVFTAILAWRTTDLAADSRKQLIAATRAWVIPTGAKIDGDISLGKNLRIEILFENAGKEAAWDVVHLRGQGPIFDVTIDGLGMPYVDINTNPWPINTMCSADPFRVINRRTIYPSSKNQDITYVLTAPPTVNQDFIDKKKSFTVIGCFVYRTPIEPDKIRHSPYCFYFQPRREAPIDQGTFEFCPSGSANAD